MSPPWRRWKKRAPQPDHRIIAGLSARERKARCKFFWAFASTSGARSRPTPGEAGDPVDMALMTIHYVLTYIFVVTPRITPSPSWTVSRARARSPSPLGVPWGVSCKRPHAPGNACILSRPLLPALDPALQITQGRANHVVEFCIGSRRATETPPGPSVLQRHPPGPQVVP